MCNALSYKTNFSSIFEYFPSLDIGMWEDDDGNFEPYRLAHAHRRQPVIINENGNCKLLSFEWGLIADYMNTPELVKKNRHWMINARAEKFADKKSYWYRIRNQRCLVPVTGIYEHRKVKGMRNKVPYYITWKGREMFCLPALYNYSPIANQETGEIAGTFAIVTRPANKLMEQIHNDGENKFRMPLFITKEMETEWLNPDTSFETLLTILDFKIESRELEAWPVFTVQTTKPRPDGQLPNAPYEWPGLPPLGTDEIAGQQSLFD